ncbi:hypothetical protein FNF27_04818 [Cafeteria roenbergensis]|uniref:Serine/threonine-protein phosphatase 2A 55 kDa regulatory subunit B n=1 Tax=Cafeteria roenbergensis TaxID=33653 RepID=A0A5A8D7L8_CAFRO|nr:hypothetical protein FNF29_05356 [Cafeteria roenbergensis]KAA0160260.1 hypothetical protein FNF31_04425 [Cafeteria roenbergensis]KAA0160723.1 hypothetical protein FNF28_05359 [Cafeteria roenbergensis]KAA0173668.1 hypothetical protein FNF27_04818 [Cafeteria roenbergensis]|mmetsp:Transcript_412/g.1491  ORF Transcript_412/g.1491 Transcript_412/m.1491 type:complete len:509 (+) Transcript_412:156-1682(+)|eukprot:KAA0150344.1 hypothetical protein FNF29_05356 [Cafeteria roenbergensis]
MAAAAPRPAAAHGSKRAPEAGEGADEAGGGWRPSGGYGLVDCPEHWLRWNFGQCFGDRDAAEDFSEADVLSAVEFDPTGEYLATGDKGGRVVVFKRAPADADAEADAAMDESGMRTMPRPESNFRFYMEFQSHEAEFDYLKSLEIEEKINEIAWCPSSGGSLFMLTTNDKTVKLYKVHEKHVAGAEGMNITEGAHGGRTVSSSLQLPRMHAGEDTVCATSKRVFANAHAYHINSVSVNSDGQTFLSADDLRINLWSLDNAKLSFTMVDIKPEHMEELSEVITAACFHPRHCNIFTYSTSRGAVKLGDMRASALCDTHAKLFEDETEDASNKSYFSEITASVSGVAFLPGERMATRDYLSVKVWDLRTERRPLLVVPVHEHLRPRLCDLYENDSIFDKFEIAVSADGRHLLTGTYNDTVKIFDTVHGQETHVSLATMQQARPAVRRSLDPSDRDAMAAAAAAGPDAQLDFARKVLHYAWHPESDTVAIAGLNNLHIYNASRLHDDPGDV